MYSCMQFEGNQHILYNIYINVIDRSTNMHACIACIST